LYACSLSMSWPVQHQDSGKLQKLPALQGLQIISTRVFLVNNLQNESDQTVAFVEFRLKTATMLEGSDCLLKSWVGGK